MKKRSVYILLLIFCVLPFAACGYRGDPSEAFITPASSVTGTPPGEGPVSETPGYRPTWVGINPEDMPYQYGNVFRSVFGAFVWDAPDTVLMTEERSQTLVLMEYIKSTGQIESFCKLATCSHQTDDCPAGNAGGNLDMRNGTLSMGRMRVNGKGMGDFWISELRRDRFEFVAGPIKGFVMGEDGYYAITPDVSLVRFAYGSDKPEILIDEFNAIKLIVLGHYLYAGTSTGIVRVDLTGPEYGIETVVGDTAGNYSTDGSYLYYNKVENGETALYRCDLEGHDPELVLQKMIFPPYLSYDNTYIYYSTFNADAPDEPTNGDIYRFPLDLSGEPELLCATGLRYPMISVLPTSPDTLLIYGCGTKSYYFLPKEGGELIELEIP